MPMFLSRPLPQARSRNPSARNRGSDAKAVVRDAAATRAAILRAAISEFAERGVGGARVARIAEASGFSKRMIYHYFQSRENLFIAALEAIYSKFRIAEDELSLRELAPIDGMAKLVRYGWLHLNRNPEFISLLNSENLNKARYLKRSKLIRELQSPLMDTLRDLLTRGVRDGVFREDVDAVQLYITLSALSYFYLSNIHSLSAIFSTNFSGKKLKNAREDHIVDVVLGYLCCDPGAYQGR